MVSECKKDYIQNKMTDEALHYEGRDRATIKAILHHAGFQPLTSKHSYSPNGFLNDTKYVLQYRKNKDGVRFILNLYFIPSTPLLQDALRDAPIHNTVIVKCLGLVLFSVWIDLNFELDFLRR